MGTYSDLLNREPEVPADVIIGKADGMGNSPVLVGHGREYHMIGWIMRDRGYYFFGALINGSNMDQRCLRNDFDTRAECESFVVEQALDLNNN